MEECGHIHLGQYPPENCPGEVTDEFPVDADETVEAITEWQNKHGTTPQSKDPHRFCGLNPHQFIVVRMVIITQTFGSELFVVVGVPGPFKISFY